jgi:hypothetical protein
MRTDVGSSRDDQVTRKEPTSVSRRVTPSERLRAEVDEVFASGADLATAIEQVARIGARLLLQTALEAEATEFLAWIHRADCDRERVVTEEVPFDLGESGLLKLRNPPSKGHLVDAIVAYRGEDSREV